MKNEISKVAERPAFFLQIRTIFACLGFIDLMASKMNVEHDFSKIFEKGPVLIQRVAPHCLTACGWHAKSKSGSNNVLTKEQSSKIESIQSRALMITFPNVSHLEALQTAGLETLANRCGKLSQNLFKKTLHPKHKLHFLLPEQRTINYNLRNCRKYPAPKIRCKRTLRSPIVYRLSYVQ